MFARDLHLLLTIATLAAMLAVTVEAAVRLARGRPPGRFAARSLAVVLILVAMAAAGGLALLVGGHRPREWWHAMYAGFAFAMIPLADSVTLRASPRWKAVARLIGALIAIEVIVRLFQTG
jgi:hypothetical protein